VRDDAVGVLVDDPAVEAAAYLGQCRGRTVDCGAASGFENSGLPYLKMLRPDLGGDPAAREPGLGTGRGGDVTGSANSF